LLALPRRWDDCRMPPFPFDPGGGIEVFLDCWNEDEPTDEEVD
jgi:hypothetical protein